MKQPQHNQSRRWRFLGVGLGLVATTFFAATAYAASPTPAYIPQAADWLTTVNYYRSMAGVSPVTEDPTMSAGAAAHSCYMLYNGIAHDETPGLTGLHARRRRSRQQRQRRRVERHQHQCPQSRRTVDDRPVPRHRRAAPEPAHNRLRPLRPRRHADLAFRRNARRDPRARLGTAPRRTRSCSRATGPPRTSTASSVESPNPLTFCGWSGPAGLPIIAMMPEAADNASATLTGPNGPIDVCVLSAANTNGVAQQILQGDNAVIIVPRTVLPQGAFSVSANTSARTVNWSFNVDPAAALGVAPTPVAAPSAPATGFAPLAPARIVDTRIPMGASRLAGVARVRIQVTGVGGVPSDAKAVVANATITRASGVPASSPCGTAPMRCPKCRRSTTRPTRQWPTQRPSRSIRPVACAHSAAPRPIS